MQIQLVGIISVFSDINGKAYCLAVFINAVTRMCHIVVKILLIFKLSEPEVSNIFELSKLGEEEVMANICSIVWRLELDTNHVQIVSHEEIEGANVVPELIEDFLAIEE